MSYIRDRIEEALAGRATRLDLSAYDDNERLTALPAEILTMTWLEELILSGHDLRSLPKEVGRLDFPPPPAIHRQDAKSAKRRKD